MRYCMTQTNTQSSKTAIKKATNYRSIWTTIHWFFWKHPCSTLQHIKQYCHTHLPLDNYYKGMKYVGIAPTQFSWLSPNQTHITAYSQSPCLSFISKKCSSVIKYREVQVHTFICTTQYQIKT